MAAMRTFDATERRARLAVRHHLSPAHRATGVLDATDGVVCLHATDPATVYLSAWARVEGLQRDEVDRALYTDRTLVKHLAMRRTLFVLRRELLPVVQAAASRRVADQEERRLAKDVERHGLAADGARWVKEAQAAALAALAEMGEATSAQLRKADPILDVTIPYALDKSYGGDMALAPRVLTTLSAGGRVLRASNQGGWAVSRPTWARTADWLGQDPPVPPEREARAELVRRWLRAFGPATVEDLKWWLGSTMTAVRAALADVGAVEVDIDGRPGVVLPDDLDPVGPVAPYAALLPGLDPSTMGWFEREWYLGPHRPQVFDSNGNAGATAWWDGRVVGDWHQTDSGDVAVHRLEDVGAEATAALDAEAARLTAWLGGARIAARFPSPLARSRRPSR
jgi:hypothetical protein